jgi:tRNA(Ile)-lysidine synthase
VAVLAAAPAGVRRAALRAAAIGAGSPPGALSRAHVLALDALVTDWHGQGPVPLPGGIEASRRYGRLFLHRPETRPDTKPGTSPGKGPKTGPETRR